MGRVLKFTESFPMQCQLMGFETCSSLLSLYWQQTLMCLKVSFIEGGRDGRYRAQIIFSNSGGDIARSWNVFEWHNFVESVSKFEGAILPWGDLTWYPNNLLGTWLKVTRMFQLGQDKAWPRLYLILPKIMISDYFFIQSNNMI